MVTSLQRVAYVQCTTLTFTILNWRCWLLIHSFWLRYQNVFSYRPITGVHFRHKSARFVSVTSMDNGQDHDYDGEPGQRQRYCENCCVKCGEDGDHACYRRRVCHNCMRMRECFRCRRRLPDVCFDDLSQNTCEACKDRTKRRSSLRRKTALCQRIAQVDFNLDSHSNGTYEQVFHSVATDISSTIQQQIDICGWVCVCVCVKYMYVIRIYKYVL